MRAVNHWRPLGHFRACVRRALQVLFRKDAMRALNGWLDLCKIKKNQLRMLRLGASALLQRMLRRACSGWMEAATIMANQKRLLKKGLSVFNNRKVRHCFNSQAAMAAARRAAFQKIAYAAGRLLNKLVLDAHKE